MKRKKLAQGVAFHHSIVHFSNGSVRKYLEHTYPFKSNEKQNLIDDIMEFRQRLYVAGIPLASEYELFLGENNDDDSSIIIEETINCGVDGYKAIKADPNSKGKEVLSQIVKALLPILSEPQVCLVPDPHPANWCFNEAGKVHYVDFQPPRFERENGIKLVGFPQPEGKEYEWSVKRYYSKTGLIRILRFNAIRAGGFSMRESLSDILRRELPLQLFREMTEELKDLLEERVRRNELSVTEALAGCDVWSIDDIRELAMVVAEGMKTETTTFLDNVLEATRADFNIPLPEREKNVEEAKKLILQNVLRNERESA